MPSILVILIIEAIALRSHLCCTQVDAEVDCRNSSILLEVCFIANRRGHINDHRYDLLIACAIVLCLKGSNVRVVSGLKSGCGHIYCRDSLIASVGLCAVYDTELNVIGKLELIAVYVGRTDLARYVYAKIILERK